MVDGSTVGRPALGFTSPIRREWQCHGDDFEAVDPRKVIRVAGVHGKVVGQRRRGNHRVGGASVDLATRSTQRCGHATEHPRDWRIERQLVEVGLGLLQVSLACGTFCVGRCHQEAYG